MIKSKLNELFLGLLFLLVFLGYAIPVRATLGKSASSVESDRKALAAVKRPTTSHDSYGVHEMYSGANTVREYVSQSGIVFGISWNGLFFPDIDQLLGSYSNEYHKALQRTPRQKGSRHLHVEASGVIVEKWGHMRDLHGRAYAPALIPSGVSVDEIR